jgi:hypothetical protein
VSTLKATRTVAHGGNHLFRRTELAYAQFYRGMCEESPIFAGDANFNAGSSGSRFSSYIRRTVLG